MSHRLESKEVDGAQASEKNFRFFSLRLRYTCLKVVVVS